MNVLPNIFIIDDDPVCQILLRIGISQTGQQNTVKTFNNGKEAIEHIEFGGNDTGDILIFLDLNMPVMNGWDFLDRLLHRDYKKRVVVVITSTSSLTEDKNRALKYPQVKLYQVKPLDPAFVKCLVEDFLKCTGSEENLID